MTPGQLATAAQPCLAHGRTDTHLYACGWRCPACTPAALAGRPEPDTARYCAPSRCYCGQATCPARLSYSRPLEPIRRLV